MKKHKIIYENLQDKIDSNKLTMEDVDILDDIDNNKYDDDMTEYTEPCDYESMNYDEYFDFMEDVLISNKKTNI